MELQIDYVDVRERPPRPGLRAALASPPFWIFRAIGWTALGVVALGGVGLGVGAVFGSQPFSVMTVLFALLLLTSLGLLLRNLRRSRTQAVLAYLEQAVRLNLPLPAMLRAAEGAESPAVRRQLARLREQLEGGMAVSVGLDAAVTGLSARAVGLIDFGERTGRLAEALQRQLRRGRTAPATDPSGDILIRWYPLVMVMAVAAVATRLCVFVIPKFKSILHDFNLPVPAVTNWLPEQEWLLFLAPVSGGLVFLVFVGRLTAQILSPRLSRYSPVGKLTDRLAWYLPPLRGVVRPRGLADVCNLLGDALSAGRDPHLALTDAAALPLNAVVRRRLLRWASAAPDGLSLADGARAAGMPPLVVGMLSSAPAGDGSAEQVLRFLARYYESRFSRASQLLRGAAVPLLAVVFGALTAVLALSIFLPLVELIDKLAPPGGGPM